jgi:hypothetical protein
MLNVPSFDESFNHAVNMEDGDTLDRPYVLGLIRELDKQGQALASLHRMHNGSVLSVPEDLAQSTAAHLYDTLIAQAVANGNAGQAQELVRQRSKLVNRVFI